MAGKYKFIAKNEEKPTINVEECFDRFFISSDGFKLFELICKSVHRAFSAYLHKPKLCLD